MFKIKITNEKLPLFRHSLGVKKLNFDMIIAETDNFQRLIIG